MFGVVSWVPGELRGQGDLLISGTADANDRRWGDAQGSDSVPDAESLDPDLGGAVAVRVSREVFLLSLVSTC